jgi:hypothetical protein
MLIVTQLSNYDSNGKFILEADSGYQMMMGRVRELLKLVPDLHIDITGPYVDFMNPSDRQVITPPWYINPDLFQTGRVRYIENWIRPNALATRYDFDFESIQYSLSLKMHKTNPEMRYDVVYMNDPMLLRNYKAMFFIEGGYQPRFVVHSHFIDDPSCPKFPKEASLWLGQCEAAIKADYNFWQCQSSLDIFETEMRKLYRDDVVDAVMKKSSPWDDGYSIKEITQSINEDNIRFDKKSFDELCDSKTVIFVPNRIGGKGRSSDYTNCGKFMFELLPKLYEKRGKLDFAVVCGNPSQKIFNHELTEWCGCHGYVNLIENAPLSSGTLNRDEYRYVASHAHIAVGLYDQDSYGGTASRECIELGCVPMWIDNYEYATIAKSAGWPYIASPDFGTEFILMFNALIDLVKSNEHVKWKSQLKSIVQQRCSYEETTPKMLNLLFGK